MIDEAIDAGVDAIQLREPDLDGRPLSDLTTRIRLRAASTSSRVLVNDRADVALASGAHGVHLRADGPPVGRVRRLGPDGWLVGRSVHTVTESRAASDAGADYLMFGTLFSGGSKGTVPDDSSLDRLRESARVSRAPVIAIGGIDAARAEQCIDAGASGVAAISIFLPVGRAPLALGVRRATADLRRAVER